MKKNPVTYDQFSALDVRVGKIVKADLVSNSKKLIRL